MQSIIDEPVQNTVVSDDHQPDIVTYDEIIQLAKNNDPAFTTLFINKYPQFIKTLKIIQPNLTLSEKKICYYTKLNFTTKEIANYTFVSVKAVQNRKNRLRKRLSIPDGVDIYVWFDKFGFN